MRRSVSRLGSSVAVTPRLAFAPPRTKLGNSRGRYRRAAISARWPAPTPIATSNAPSATIAQAVPGGTYRTCGLAVNTSRRETAWSPPSNRKRPAPGKGHHDQLLVPAARRPSSRPARARRRGTRGTASRRSPGLHRCTCRRRAGRRVGRAGRRPRSCADLVHADGTSLEPAALGGQREPEGLERIVRPRRPASRPRPASGRTPRTRAGRRPRTDPGSSRSGRPRSRTAATTSTRSCAAPRRRPCRGRRRPRSGCRSPRPSWRDISTTPRAPLRKRSIVTAVSTSPPSSKRWSIRFAAPGGHLLDLAHQEPREVEVVDASCRGTSHRCRG